MLLLLLLPVTVFSLALNDRREFLIPVESTARAFTAATASTGGGPAVAGLVIQPRVPGEPRRLLPQLPGRVIPIAEPTQQAIGPLAFAEPTGPALEYAPAPTPTSGPGGRPLPQLPQGGGNDGGGIGLLNPAPSPTPTEPPNGIPEPESWALTLLGFGIVGVALRRRRQVGVRQNGEAA